LAVPQSRGPLPILVRPGRPEERSRGLHPTEPGLFTDTGEVTDESGAHFLRDYMAEFREFIVRVLTVLPGQA
jgi:hypothetical protein